VADASPSSFLAIASLVSPRGAQTDLMAGVSDTIVVLEGDETGQSCWNRCAFSLPT
jgi:hypothetical protein